MFTRSALESADIELLKKEAKELGVPVSEDRAALIEGILNQWERISQEQGQAGKRQEVGQRKVGPVERGAGGRYPAKEKNVIRVLGQRRGRVDFSRSVAASADGGNDHDDGTAAGAATSTTGVFHAAAAAAQHHDAAGVGQRARSGC